ncbi:5-carboxymethyl-2-hydroxymuconate semialdehyde dehydrogenase [uncultured Maritimibacter sp.]|jgi:5-carboxymethyl-2-hydroxymuconic-semialdehyde dehydrogenase|uniref:5-carboxymethyl-2-hydroxymuconate semialdehyde dehydrogenase n=1 Tax=uncultured Maritimibacter sp. TaxID=991866 RepID=UPI000B2E3EA6|nr:5-carboxymethyl-2-hydroxymuconate semialdehyde dehydrogenase [uncultured Maritimibacter sp.]
MSVVDDNIAKAKDYMARFAKDGVLNHIAGENVPAMSGETMDTISPVDGSVLAKVAKSDAADIDAAVAAAKAAFPAWSKTPGAERRKILIKVAEAIEARAEEIAFTECMDTGQALRFMSKAAIRGAANFRFFADQAPTAEDGAVTRTPTQMNTTSRRPIGPVGVITPWNTPFMLSTWKIAPALAAGCTVVHKPAEFSPMTAKKLVEIAEEAGLPKGVLNVVNGLGETAGKRLTEHPDIKAIAFVGESRTGSMIMAQGAPTLKRVHFELGGKNPVIVFDDADIERAVDAATFMIYSLNGERCTSSSRLLVQESIYDEVTEKVAAVAKRIKVGHPLDPETVVGPLIHPVHEKKVLSYFDKAREEGATIAAGGEKIGTEGCYVSPTLFTGATNQMAIAQEEIFGPVLTAIPFKDEDEALALANDVEYGLAAYLWTNDLNRAMRMTDSLEAGMMWVNSENIRHLPTPFGGVKASGIGRDGGDWSFDFYMETVNVSFPRTGHKIPKLGG